jgi:DNA mismatch repair protein MutS
VIVRAREILNNLENMELTPDHKPVLARKKEGGYGDAPNDALQLNAIDEQAASIVDRLKTLDVNSMTPIDAMNVLFELRKKALE